jgi:hypothetical protein
MFLDELTPVLKELTSQPISFLGGFFSGLFRLNLAEDPVKSWLDENGGTSSQSMSSASTNGNGSGPQSISID